MRYIQTFWSKHGISLLIIYMLSLGIDVSAQVKSQKLTPLSPNSAALWKYAEMPVNMYTGIPGISIPIYEIKSGNITVPVSLSYHAGGIRYEEQATWVGLGWSLIAGGTISRNIKGVADEKAEGILYQSGAMSDTSSSCNYEFFNLVDTKSIDTQPDEFSYSMPNKNGRFLFKKGTSQPITIPYAPLKVAWDTGGAALGKFELVDETGTTYRYGKYKSQNIYVRESTSGGAGVFTEDAMPNSWMMVEIESADKTKNITFTYDSLYSSIQKLSKSDRIEILDNVTGGNEDGSFCTAPSPSVGNAVSTNLTYSTATKYLKEIFFNNGKITFEKSAINRKDLNSDQKALDNIKIYAFEDNTYVLRKKIRFVYSYFKKDSTGTLVDFKLKLDTVKTYNAEDSLIEQYSFDYHTTNFSGDKANANDFNAQDWWGYFNGKTSNTNLIPEQSITYAPYGVSNPPQQIGGADRSVDTAFMKEGVLKKIIYPTGGYTQFDFESNRYDASGTKHAGGLRIKKMATTASPVDTPMIKTYVYGPGGNGYGKPIFISYLGYFLSEDEYRCRQSAPSSGSWSWRTRTYTSSASMQIDGFESTPVIYPNVTEIVGTASANIGKTEYEYDNGGYVTDDISLPYYGSSSSVQRRSKSWLRGHLTRKTVYGANGSRKADTRTEYQTLRSFDQLMGIIVDRRLFYTFEEPIDCSSDGGIYRYAWVYYPLTSGVVLPLEVTDKSYDQVDTARYTSTVTNYQYDTTYLQLKQSSVTLRDIAGSHEEQQATYTKYPFDYSFSGTPSGTEAEGIKHLQDINVFNAVVEQYKERTTITASATVSRIVGGIINTYLSNKPWISKIWEMELQRPLSSGTFGSGSSLVSNAFSKNSAYQTGVDYNNYDSSGMPSQLTARDGIVRSFTWNNTGDNVTSEVTNAAHGDIAFTSFETNEGNGNWDFSSAGITGDSSVTGVKSYSLATSNIERTGLDNEKLFVVTYWLKNGASCSINGGSGGNALIAKNGWTLYERRITGVTTVTISGSGLIDELRLYPAKAQMTTYTYQSLLGMTSQCDINNRITYYEYDSLGRLLRVRDHDKNILKSYQYKYRDIQ